MLWKEFTTNYNAPIKKPRLPLKDGALKLYNSAVLFVAAQLNGQAATKAKLQKA